MEVVWVVLLTALIAFCLRMTYKRGYKAGAVMVLDQWKEAEQERYRAIGEVDING